jgi:hypothetical protein
MFSGCAGGRQQYSFTKIYNSDPANPANWICQSRYGSSCIKKILEKNMVVVEKPAFYYEKGGMVSMPDSIIFKKIKKKIRLYSERNNRVLHSKRNKRIMATDDDKSIPVFYSFRTDYTGWTVMLVNTDDYDGIIEGNLCIKYIKPDGTLWRNSSGPEGCTVIKSFSLTDQVELSGKWGRKDRSVYRGGVYTIEFWLAGIKIAEYDFYVIEKFL